MSRGLRAQLPALLALVLLAAAVAAVAAGEGTSDPIKARQEAMETVGDAMKELSGIAKGQTAFDAALVATDAKRIADELVVASGHFPEGSDQGSIETWAKPEIWASRADFDAKLEAAHTAALDLAKVSDPAAFPPAFSRLGGACKSCHESYRRPKE